MARDCPAPRIYKALYTAWRTRASATPAAQGHSPLRPGVRRREKMLFRRWILWDDITQKQMTRNNISIARAVAPAATSSAAVAGEEDDE